MKIAYMVEWVRVSVLVMSVLQKVVLMRSSIPQRPKCHRELCHPCNLYQQLLQTPPACRISATILVTLRFPRHPSGFKALIQFNGGT